MAKNGRVPIGGGVRCDEVKALERIIDHLKSNVHNAAECEAKSKMLWEKKSEKHP